MFTAPLLLTCNNEVTTKANTFQSRPRGGKICSRGPLRGVSGPGLSRGEVVREVVSSSHNINLHEMS